MKRKRGLIIAALAIGLAFALGGAGAHPIGFGIGMLLKGLGIAIGSTALLIGGSIAAIIYFGDKKQKKLQMKQQGHTPIDTTWREVPTQNTAQDNRTAVEKLFYPYRTSPGLGSIVHTALTQSRRHEEQERKYSELVARRFGVGTMTYTKYMTLQADATDAMFRVYQKIANRMVAFDDKEYQHLSTSMYKYDSIPDDVQEARLQLYNDNLKEMKDSLRENEQTMYAIDQLLLQLADAHYSESGIQDQIETLSKQLEYYKQAL